MKVWISEDEKFPDYSIYLKETRWANFPGIEIPEELVQSFIDAQKNLKDFEDELEEYLTDDKRRKL